MWLGAAGQCAEEEGSPGIPVEGRRPQMLEQRSGFLRAGVDLVPGLCTSVI